MFGHGSAAPDGICTYKDCQVVGPRCSFTQCVTHCREHHKQYHIHPQDLGSAKYNPMPATLVAETEAA